MVDVITDTAYLGVEYADTPVLRAADKELPRRVEQYAPHPVLMCAQRDQAYTFHRIPDLDAAVSRSGGEVNVIRAQLARLNHQQQIASLTDSAAEASPLAALFTTALTSSGFLP